MRFLSFAVGTLGLCFAASLHAEVTQINVSLPGATENLEGRLFVVFSRSEGSEPRLSFGREVVPTRANPFFAGDVTDWNGDSLVFTASAGYPLATITELETGRWYVQALYDTNTLMSNLNDPGNYYSETGAIDIDDQSTTIELSLSNRIADEVLPEDSELLKFVKIRSDLLSDFYQADVYLRASVLLPVQYETNSSQRYPVLYHVAGMNGRYRRSLALLRDEEFMEYWQDESTRPAVMVFLDGESPFGDSYQVNSAVSGPYADANFSELFPYLAANFPIADTARTRFVSGCSTGGWVSMALQVFYPSYFNGSYSLSPDSPSFRAFQLVDLYDDDNAFISDTGMTRPSARTNNGDPRFSIADELRMEAAIGSGDNFVNSGKQWGGWNAVYGQPDSDGSPIPIWDQQTGEINRAVVDSWQQWDIDLYLRDNWEMLGPRLQGKLHFWMGDMDEYYLNNGLRQLEQTLSVKEAPGSDAEFTWVPNHGHCGFGTETHYINVLRHLTRKAAAN